VQNRHRLTSRILLFDERDRILLYLTVGSVPAEQTRWITPGGGVEPGESHAEGARRELFEETGLDIPDLGAPVWTQYYVLRTTAFEPSRENWTAEEQFDVLETRWWTLAELADTTEPFRPPELLDLIRSQLRPH
jgi:8-oxo-dGTP pyrophosphatase MutT (NUDIX family)